MDNKLGLYLHIPYCKSKCAYCDFYSVSERTDYQRYADSLIFHMQDYSPSAMNYEVDTVFIGGGTPSVMPGKTLLGLIGGIYSNFNVTKDAEVTVECNPATINYGQLKKLHSNGVNRLSIGLQSTCDNELASLSRAHNYENFENCWRDVRGAGFSNINIDLMYGIPEQTIASLKMSLETVCELGPEHISLYGLKIEPGTLFHDMKSTLILPDEDDEYEMYEMAVSILEKNGYKQYEISNFARHGFECKHNLKYWNCEEYLGLGPAAHSYFGNCRFSFKRDIGSYIQAMEKDTCEEDIIDEYYEVSPSERVGEYIMLRMRLNDGIDTEKFRKLFGLDFDRLYGKYLTAYIDNGYMIKTATGYAFTTKGRYVSNHILSTMLDFNSDIVYNIANGTDK